MSSNLKVNTILPSTGTTIGIGTVGGLINVVGNIDVNSTSGISTFNGLEISGIVTAKAGAAVTYYGDGSGLTNVPLSGNEIAINGVFYENDINVTKDYTITEGKNAFCGGPITIDSDVTVTIPTGSNFTVI